MRRLTDRTFEVEVSGLNHHEEELLIDRIIETIKDFGVESEDFRIFVDDDDDESETEETTETE